MQSQRLEDYQWKNRILILCDTSSVSEALQSQLLLFTAQQEALIDRDMIIFLLTENGVFYEDRNISNMKSKEMRESLGASRDFKGVLLVGKDGGVKLREGFGIDPKKVFELIDGMPMRRAEMRKNNR